MMGSADMTEMTGHYRSKQDIPVMPFGNRLFAGVRLRYDDTRIAHGSPVHHPYITRT